MIITVVNTNKFRQMLIVEHDRNTIIVEHFIFRMVSQRNRIE